MAQRKWIDQSQPQTLQGAVLFSYLSAALAVLSFLAFGALPSLVLVLMAGAAYGIANDKRIAYRIGVVLAALYVIGQLAALFLGSGLFGLLGVVFAVVLLVLLVHPQSRAYEKVWFH